MMSSVIPARLLFQCGHAALVSLPRIKGETSPQRADRVAREKSAAHSRACDFCAQHLEVVVQQAAPAPSAAPVLTPLPTPLPAVPRSVPTPLVTPAQAAPVAAVPLAQIGPTPLTPVARVLDTSVKRVAVKRVKPLAVVNTAQPVAPVKTVATVKPLPRVTRVATKKRPRGGQSFVVRLKLQTVLQATDVSDALRQAQSLGAIEVIEIARQR